MNSLPHKKTKNHTFSVRCTDEEHEAFVKVARAEGECRAVTFVELAKRGLAEYAKELELSIEDADLEEVLYKRNALLAAKKVS